jgi:hypothetical protein
VKRSEKQSRANEQHNSDRQLARDEAEPKAAVGTRQRGATVVVAQRHTGNLRCHDGRNEAGCEGTEYRDRNREREHAWLELERRSGGQCARCNGAQREDAELRNRHAHDTTEERERCAFSEKLSDEPPASSAEGDSN